MHGMMCTWIHDPRMDCNRHSFSVLPLGVRPASLATGCLRQKPDEQQLAAFTLVADKLEVAHERRRAPQDAMLRPHRSLLPPAQSPTAAAHASLPSDSDLPSSLDQTAVLRLQSETFLAVSQGHEGHYVGRTGIKSRRARPALHLGGIGVMGNRSRLRLPGREGWRVDHQPSTAGHPPPLRAVFRCGQKP